VQAGVTRAAAIVVALALTLTPSAAADPPPAGITHVHVPPGTPLVEYGRQLFAANCASCHGPAGKGIFTPMQGAGDETGLGPSLRGVGALAADFYLRTGSMPLESPHRQPRRDRVLFSEREIRALVAYIASLGAGPAVPTPHPGDGNLAAGLQLFTEHCAGCHQVLARGGYVTGAVAPSLDSSTSVQIAEAVRAGPYLMPRFSRRQISDAQLDSIIRYVQYAKHPDDRGGWAIGHVGPVPEGLVTWFIGIAAIVATCVVIGRRLHS
jgi:ubiquinol-cytochrome c reductase cytochrome c subunit